MPDDPRVRQLLDELLDGDGTPEDVCRSCPDLLPVVRDRWRQMSRARAELDAVFPPAGGPGTTSRPPPRRGGGGARVRGPAPRASPPCRKSPATRWRRYSVTAAWAS